ncbi:MAG: aspartyl/glutamyl-tRNA amidotransferase subunit A [Defluviitaleaceae bacterium]|nr:aspartyl/glutamyl-tRNA amidotransferase subunit A [Defluviitaleaceae bacterium]
MIHTKTAVELCGLIRGKELKPSEVCESFLSRCDENPGAYLHLDKDAVLSQAKELDNAAITSETPALFGLPVAIKDNICTKGVPTTCASKMLENFVPPYDATVVSRLKDSGAIILGKTNMDEFAMGCVERTMNAGGASHDPARAPGFEGTCGSRDVSPVLGGAAAVAATSAPVAVGSDTGGAIRLPAAQCGVVGYRPTYGAVSRYGLMAYAGSFDQIGLIAGNVSDAALLASVIAGHDSRDSKSVPGVALNFSQIENFDMRGKKIGMLSQCFNGVDADVAQAVGDAAKVYESLGATVEEVSVPLVEHCLPVFYIIALGEASSNLSRYDGVGYGYRTANAGSLDELYVNSRTEGFGATVKQRLWLGTYLLSAGNYEKYFEKALVARAMLAAQFKAAFEKYDFLLSPVSPKAAHGHDESPGATDVAKQERCTVPASLAGLPAVSIPCGTNKSVGVQLIANRFNDADLLGAARVLEVS